ncbi:MAG TPA: vanadium-dependent haloperoxidase [Kofleriaceae bacterium]|nr:vanadium-dependent haloperoxidase [Kofleriaceae bacterium]
MTFRAWAAAASVLAAGCSSSGPAPARTAAPAEPDEPALVVHRAPNPEATIAYRWIDIMLEVTGREVDHVGARPTIISRQMAIAVTAMYDAWAAYDERAVGTRLGGALRRPPAERTLAAREKAISYAMYRALVDLFPSERDWLADQMRALGQDPNDDSLDRATPQGIGNTAAEAVLAYRADDGANQRGTEPYGDTTGYAAVNPADRIVDPDRWQPIPFIMADGSTKTLGYLTPHWHLVKPFALERADQFRPPPPPKVASAELRREVDEVLAFNAGLTDEQRSIVEFMRDGPHATGQSGHWMQFAQDVSRRDHHDLDQDVKMFFAIGNTAFDAFIAAWDSKRVYDSSRPWTLVRHYYKGKTVKGWLGPCKGVGDLPAEKWHPYSPSSFITPPFPGYVSGHSAVSGACAKMLELFTGSDRYGVIYRHHPGVYTEEACQEKGEVELLLPTFTATAEMAGLSRIMGGYHIRADNVEGLKLGRAVATYSWPKYQAYFDGTAAAPAPH